jgi:endonuclease YncB( thermonuclease family)
MHTRRIAPRAFGWLVVLAALAAGQMVVGSPAPPARRFEAEVVGVIDGDTIDVLVGRQKTRIRIEGIDCPELAQPFGRAAKQFASDRVFGKRVEILSQSTDRYGRTIARVRVGDEDLGLALLKAGLAWQYTTYSHDPIYGSAERRARLARQGLWADKDPVPPWVERRHAAAPKVPARPVPAQARAGSVAGPFHGNVKSMVFHAPGCPNYNCTQCTAVFATAQDAVAKGFRPAADCPKK